MRHTVASYQASSLPRFILLGLVSLSLFSYLGGVAVVLAAEPAADKAASETREPEAGGAVTEVQIARWIEQLDAPRFAERQAATNHLYDARQAALPALEKAVQSPSREVSERALGVLRRHFRDMDERMREAARAVLERLAGGEGTRVASAAREVLNPTPVANPLAAPPRVAPGIRLAAVRAQAQIQIQAGNGKNARKISTRQGADGKFTDIEEGGRTVRIAEPIAGGVKLEIVETKDGKQETRKFEAKDWDDLKKKHPEAHKVYEEVSKLLPRMNVQVAPGLPVPGVPVPGLPVPGVQIPGLPAGGVPGGIGPQIPILVPGQRKANRVPAVPVPNNPAPNNPAPNNTAPNNTVPSNTVPSNTVPAAPANPAPAP